MTRRKRRHAPYTTDDSRRRFPPPEAQPQPRIHPSDLIDDREAAQQREIEKLLQKNRSLAGAHVSLNQELSAVQHELRLLSSTAATVKTERDAEVREVYDEARKKESDVRILDELRVELARVRSDIQNLVDDRIELTAKLQNMEKDLVKVGSELQQLPVIKAEIESMHKEVQRGRQSYYVLVPELVGRSRAAINYEKKMHTSNLEYSQAMEKHKITLASEIEKLHAELANAEKRARAAAAAAAPSNLNRQISAATPNFTYSANYGNPETGYGENLYPAPYAVHQSLLGTTSPLSGGLPPPEPPSKTHLFSSQPTCFMDNIIFFSLGGKSYDITESKSKSGIWGAMPWICQKLKEASKNRGKTFKSWKCKDNTTNIFLTQKFNQYEKFVSVITVKGNDRAVIILPENTFNEGWNVLVAKIENFINRNRTTLITNKQLNSLIKLEGRRATKRCFSRTNGLRETQRKKACWTDAWWGVSQELKTLQLVTTSEDGLNKLGTEPREFKEIGDGCGGWLEIEDERGLKNHLRWARIRVKGPREKISATIDVGDGDLISFPIWPELPSIDRKLTTHWQLEKGENNS
ncbi:hypothetical protein MTR67_039288 [Solanum verrucosum]|uniref:Uncharacterized protein n=1 Tax=Solanum verrucosum TaxID=315347 RepID=A0AAF0ZQ93_SOLVR|nr:hypothetical protein MTR67_039288 [Solanum verrucosum]